MAKQLVVTRPRKDPADTYVWEGSTAVLTKWFRAILRHARTAKFPPSSLDADVNEKWLATRLLVTPTASNAPEFILVLWFAISLVNPRHARLELRVDGNRVKSFEHRIRGEADQCLIWEMLKYTQAGDNDDVSTQSPAGS